VLVDKIRQYPRAVIVAALGILLLIIFGSGSLLNAYKESAFAKRQAAYEQQIKDAEARAATAETGANKLKEAGKLKDAEIISLQNEVGDLQKSVAEKRVVYLNSRRPVVPRPVGSGVSDDELRRDAARLGFIVRQP